MAISVVSVDPGRTIQSTHLSSHSVQVLSGLSGSPITFTDFTDVTVFVGVVECVFKGGGLGVSREVLEFLIPDPKEQSPNLRIDIDGFQDASATVSLASFAYDGPVTDALWAVDSAGARLTNEDSGTGTANLLVGAALAVRGLSGNILRVNYTVFATSRSGGIAI